MTMELGREGELICTATSSPRGQVMWMAKKVGQSSFSPAFDDVSTDVVTKRDSCGYRHRLTVKRVFDVSWNDAVVRCDVNSPPSTSEEVRLIALSIRNSSYDYIPGTPANITCILASSHFITVSVYKTSSKTQLQLSQFHRDGNDVALVSRATTLRVAEGRRLLLITTLAEAECEDSGVYECRNESGNMARGMISIFAPHRKPEITLPLDIISGTETSLICDGMTSSQGFLYWTAMRPTETDFSVVFKSDTRSQVLTSGPCNVTRRLRTTQVLDMSWNGTLLRCDSSQPVGSPDIKQLLVIPATVCQGKDVGSHISHPYTCQRFLNCLGQVIRVSRCPGNLCFDERLDYCNYPPGK
ncbi:hypothetical protein ACOMHN_000833 [Nucella lapillus]